MSDKILITKQTTPEEITQVISKLREHKGKEKEVLKIIKEALGFGHQFVVNLFFEEALTHQHLNRISDMEKTVLKASYYVNKYKLTEWNSRLFRFMGRVADYKGQYKKAISYYKKSIKYVNLDPEPFRSLELEGLLAFAILMSGKIEKGYKYSKKTYLKYTNTKVGLALKQKDYFTWEVWRSGVGIRTINTLLDKQSLPFHGKKYNFSMSDANNWLLEVEAELNAKGYDFSYRKSELSELKEKLKLN